MNKIELLRRGLEFYPCPKYLGKDVNISFLKYTHSNIYDIYISNDCDSYTHVCDWLDNICLILNISPHKILVY